MRVSTLLLAVAMAGCVHPGVFVCQEDRDCAVPAGGGRCEGAGWCSLPDVAFGSGRRAGGLAGVPPPLCTGLPDGAPARPDAAAGDGGTADAAPPGDGPVCGGTGEA